MHISINDTVKQSSKIYKQHSQANLTSSLDSRTNKDSRITQGSHEPKPFIPGGGDDDDGCGVEGSRLPQQRRLDPLASIANVNPNRPNPNPMNPSALGNPGRLGGHGDNQIDGKTIGFLTLYRFFLGLLLLDLYNFWKNKVFIDYAIIFG